MKIDCFIFDFDGTLAEFRLDFAQMKQRLNSLASSYLAIPPPQPFLPALEWLAWLEARIGESGGRSEAFHVQAMAMISEMEVESAKCGALFRFTRPLLKMLKESGAKTAIITRNCEAAVRVVFPDLLDVCPAFFSRDQVISPKPDPAHVACALEFLRADPRTAIMIGDHPMDIKTGKAAGIFTAGVCSGSASRSELLAAGADWIARDCEELIKAAEWE
ncbi:MAG: HAD family hydrolase [Syntrophobacteraceae bacterium]|nr:HAD family hydrolase [Syntrophobacteraceae bacterium]